MSIQIRLQALGDLLTRYKAVFSHAWQHRHVLAGPGYTTHEAAFLPAALSLQETPVSPAPRVAMWLLVGFALCGLGWAIFGKIDVVATAQGRIVPNDRSKTIQPLERAVVKAIHVSDGQAVKAGDILVELDGTVTQADLDRIATELSSARLQVLRAQGLIRAIDSGRVPALNRPEEVSDTLWQQTVALLSSQYGDYAARRANLMATETQREAELNSTREVVRKLEQTVPIARQRAEDYKGLVEKKFMSHHGYLEKEQLRIEQEADLATQRSKLKELEAAVQAAQAQLLALTTETRRTASDSANEGVQKIASLEQELRKARSRNQDTILEAPVDGTVQQLAIHTVGGVVTEAQALMVIVPKDNPVEIEAFVENKDIGFVREGQEAEVKIETFQYTKYGTIESTVSSVSNDAINDEKRGLIYSTRVKMSKSSLNVDGREVRLSPGMAVGVEIKTGRRRVIEYFLSPLMEYAHESLRER